VWEAYILALKPSLARYDLKAIQKSCKCIQGFEPLHAEGYTDIIHFVVSRPYHVNIADLMVLPTAAATILKGKRLI
jgi:NADP-dependent 3-hydroxy acid dehydrogenase YdfG